MAMPEHAADQAGLSGPRLRAIAWLVTGALFMEVLDGNIIATALPDMARSFGVEALRLNVAMSAYLLALGVFIPASGWIADRLGPRVVFASAIAGFTLTSLACGLVSSLPVFVALRVLQGACGALMVPVGRLLVLRQTPPERRMAAMSNLIWPALVAPVIAPPLGGFIATHASWHWIFLLNVPLGLIAFALTWWLIPPLAPERGRSFDWIGFGLCSPGVFALLSGLDLLATEADAASLALMAAGVGLLWAAIRHFGRATSPMLDLAPLRIPTFRAAVLGGSVSRAAIGSLPFLLPLMFQLGFGFDAFHAGTLLLVMFAGNVGMKLVTTPILKRFGYRPVMLVNGVLAALSLAACALLSPDTPMALLLLILLVCGMTRSMQFTSLGTLAYADVPNQQMSDANGLFNVISQIGMAAAITLGAVCIQLGQAWAPWWHLDTPAAAYKMALIMVAVVALLGLFDTWRLPHGAGDHFVGRR